MDAIGNEFVCPTCGADVVRSNVTCPKCGNPLEWEGVEAGPGADHGGISPAPDVRPMGLGDIFDRTFRMFSAVFTRSILISLILFLPASIVLMFGAGQFYRSIGTLLQTTVASETPGPEETLALLVSLGVFAISFALAFLAVIIGEIAVTILVTGEFHGSPVAWKEALARAAGVRMLRGIGIMLLQGLAYVAIIAIPAALFGVAGGVLMVIPGLMISSVAVIFLLIRWTFSLTAVGCEDLGVTASMHRSWLLVRSGWWRVLGIILLMGLLVGFATMLITTPISLIAFWDFYREYFKALGAAGGGTPDPAQMAKVMSTMGPGLGISMGINLMISTLTRPVYATVLYFDLRARRGEFVRGS
ncbi:MAG TPA: zinc ribbon domain-containing protein [Bacteroidota bacterium]|nr:zinc ribbon domain-containing protein [Bacteroidota bacterium]